MDASPTIRRNELAAPSNAQAGVPGATQPLTRRGFPELSDLVLACRHHLLLTGLMSVLVAVAMAAIAWIMVNPVYEATSLVRVREHQSTIFSPQTTRADDLAFFRSQGRLAKSAPVLSAALSDESILPIRAALPDTNRDAWLAGLLQVRTESGTEVMDIKVQHPSPEVAQILCNAVTKAYLTEITQRLAFDREQRERELERAARAADEQLDASWDTLNQVAQSIGSDSAESFTIRDELKFQAYRDHARQLQAAQLRGNQLENQLVELQLKIDQQLAAVGQIPQSQIEQHPDVVLARKALLSLNWRVEQMQKVASGPESPRLKELLEERDFVATEVTELQDRIRKDHRERSLNSRRAEFQDALVKLQQEIDLNHRETEYLRSQLRDFDSAAVVANGAEGESGTENTAVPLDIARHAVERQSRLADGLWQTLQELRIESQSQPRVTLMEWAGLPRSASHSRQLRAASLAALGGCLMIVFFVGFAEWRDCWVRGPEDVATRSRFPVYGAASWKTSHRETKAAGNSVRLSGGVHEAGARILLRDQTTDQPNSSVMITSCAAKEPRYLVALELAMMLSSMRRRVLLVDCDMDGAQLSKTLSATKSPGMRQLSNGAGDTSLQTIADLVLATEQPTVDLLPVGQVDEQSCWIDPASLRHVLNRLRPVYDAIIICGPSMMDTAEGLLLAAEVDTSVFSVFLNRSRWSDLVLCESSAGEAGLPISGAILHSGKRLVGLRLRDDRDSLARQFAQDPEHTARALCEEIDELQQELRRASHEEGRSGAEAKQLSQRPTKN